MKKLVTLLTLLCLSVLANAQRVGIDGIWYNLESTGKTAEVTHSNGINYSGEVVIVIPETVTYEDVVYSVTSIGQLAFLAAHSLTSITIPNSVTSIGDGAFYACSGLTSIRVEDGNTVYDSREDCNAIIETATNTLIYGCQSTVIPNSVTNIGFYAFGNCSNLTSITIPNSVTSIGEQAFSGCTSLTSITIPHSVKIIGFGAFLGCSNLTSIDIGKPRSIGDYSFSGCKIYKFYSHNENVFFLDDDNFQGSGIESATLYVPQSAINDYKTTEPWSRFGSIKSLTDE